MIANLVKIHALLLNLCVVVVILPSACSLSRPERARQNLRSSLHRRTMKKLETVKEVGTEQVVPLASPASEMGSQNLNELLHKVGANPVNVTKVDDVLSALDQAGVEDVDKQTITSWRLAQQDMLERAAPVLEWFQNSTRFDRRFFEFFSEQFEKNAGFFTGLVYIPIPWYDIMLQKLDNKTRGFELAVGLLKSLTNSSTQYFTVMTQCHVSWVEFEAQRLRLVSRSKTKFSKSDDFSAQNFSGEIPWHNILIFDSRGRDDGTLPVPRIPIPLLYYKDHQENGIGCIERKGKEVFFRGECHGDPSRALMGREEGLMQGRVPGGQYEWNVGKCGEKLPLEEFQKSLCKSLWAVTPAGSMPASFAMYEALQAGSLVIVPYGRKTPKFGVGSWSLDEPFLWLPYRDIGVQWQHGLAEIVHLDELPLLRNRIENITVESARQRQSLLKHVAPLFTGQGVTTYILYMTRMLHKAHNFILMQGAEQKLSLAHTLSSFRDLPRVPDM
mmetsp:Transcript_146794/g.256089  ORF Transcript_146794/g.256089 Transcript_146794/m.256089 type:complete len:500 (-) Transcript_146794:156-1655(-)